MAVIDDDDDLRGLMVLKLRSSGYDVHEADDGVAGLELIKSSRPDLVVIDWMMPRKSGIELCRELQGDVDLAMVPVLMVTARSGSADVAASLAAGATSVLTKPFTLDDFLNAVAGLASLAGCEVRVT